MMEQMLFACDLDNTLLYSIKHALEGDVCVEWIHEKKQGFMSERTIRLLEEACGKVTVVPVTTRSIEQYQRIDFPAGCRPRYAVAANGAILLRDGERDPGWSERMAPLIEPWEKEMLRLSAELSGDERFIRCRIVDGSYLFVYCAREVNVKQCEEELAGRTPMRVQASGKKIYLLPPDLNKGTALTCLRRCFPGRRIVSAGDSEMDLEMLRLADDAIFPENLGKDLSSFSWRPDGPSGFPEFVLSTLLKLCGEGGAFPDSAATRETVFACEPQRGAREERNANDRKDRA